MSSINLPYSFAKKHGMVIQPQVEGEVVEICYKAGASLESIVEVLRVINKASKLQEVSQDTFEQIITQVYNNSSSSNQDMVDEIREEFFRV